MTVNETPLLTQIKHQSSPSCSLAIAHTHFHNAYELLYVQKGRIQISISGKSYFAGANALIFLSNVEEHVVRILEEPYERYYAMFCPALLDKGIRDPKLISVFKNRPLSFCHVFDLSSCADSVAACFALLLEEHERPSAFSDEFILDQMELLLILAYRAQPQQFPILEKRIKLEIFEVQKFIDLHFTEDLQIAALAARFYIDPYYLSHCFKELTGYSPKQYLMRSRLSYAKELLLTTDFPVQVIAYKAGFGDSNNFIRIFKKEMNLPPNQYRKEQ